MTRRNTQNVKARTTGGFTLIEVLVVVAIIALLISILLPSLRRARQQARLVACQANMKELGKACAMYVTARENNPVGAANETLPGPVHFGLLKKRLGYVANSGHDADTYAQQTYTLTGLIRKYMGEKIKYDEWGHQVQTDSSVLDKVSTCPDFPVKDGDFRQADGDPQDPFNYVVHSTPYSRIQDKDGVWTAKKYFFGHINGGYPNYTKWYEDLKDKGYSLPGGLYSPKLLSMFRQPAKEWAIADAFRSPEQQGSSGYPGLPLGPYNYDPNTGDFSGFSLPLDAFHLDRGLVANDSATNKAEYRGRVSTLFLDWHAEVQSRWKNSDLK